MHSIYCLLDDLAIFTHKLEINPNVTLYLDFNCRFTKEGLILFTILTFSAGYMTLGMKNV